MMFATIHTVAILGGLLAFMGGIVGMVMAQLYKIEKSMASLHNKIDELKRELESMKQD